MDEGNSSLFRNEQPLKLQRSQKREFHSSITKDTRQDYSLQIDDSYNFKDGFTEYGYVSTLKKKVSRMVLVKKSTLESVAKRSNPS